MAGDCILTDECRVPVPVVTFLGMVRNRMVKLILVEDLMLMLPLGTFTTTSALIVPLESLYAVRLNLNLSILELQSNDITAITEHDCDSTSL